MDNYFSQTVKDVIVLSKEEAIRLGHDFLGTEHLILGILKNGKGIAIDILNGLLIDLNYIKNKLESLHPSKGLESSKINITLTKHAHKALKATSLEMKFFKHSKVNTAHLLLCILRNEKDPTTLVLNKLGINYAETVQIISKKNAMKHPFRPNPVENPGPNGSLLLIAPLKSK